MSGKSGVAIDPPRMVSNVRRFTGVGDDITFLHDLSTLLEWSGKARCNKARCKRINDLETKAPLTSIPTGSASVIRKSTGKKETSYAFRLRS